jgi:hypothetical protein
MKHLPMYWREAAIGAFELIVRIATSANSSMRVSFVFLP